MTNREAGKRGEQANRPTPAIGHMPFPGHRTQAQVRADEARLRAAA